MPRKDEILNEDIYNAALAAGQVQKPTYAGTFDNQLAGLYEQIANRPKFQYDVNADPLYQQYKDNYIQQGKLAMRDTMGRAAALTGGYGSSYGQAVGQQAYDASLKDLAAVIPELYGVAYDKYQDEGDDLLKLYGLVGDQRDTEYKRFRDDLGDWENERDYQRQVEKEEYNRRIAEEQTAYNRQQDKLKQQQQLYANLYAMIKASGYMPSDAELEAAGMTRDAASAIAAEFQRGVDLENRNQALKEWQIGMQVFGNGGGSSGGGGGGGGSSGGGGGGGYTYSDDTVATQQMLRNAGYNIAVDGLWGPETQAAYEAYMGGGGGYSGDRTYGDTTINQYGEVRNGSNMTRGEIDRAAREAYNNGEISYEEYQTLRRSVH